MLGQPLYLDHSQFALGKVGKLDLLYCDRLASAPIEGLIDGAERPLADAVAKTLYFRAKCRRLAMFSGGYTMPLWSR